MLRRIRALPKWLNYLLILLTIVAFAAPYVHPSTSWIPSFLGSGYSWLIAANFLFILFWIINKRWYFLLSTICLLMGWNAVTTFIGLNSSSSKQTDQEINIMSYNVGGFFKLVDQDKETQAKNVEQFRKLLLKTNQVDILCTQETGWSKIITNNNFFSHQIRAKRAFIFSRFPFLDSGEIEFNTQVNACAWADVQLPNEKIIRVYSVHFLSNKVSVDADKLREEGDLQEKETWQGIRNMIGKYKRAVQQRAEQAELVAEHMAQSPYPVIIGGDFNDTALSYTYETIAANLVDNFQTAAFGIGTTYSGSIPGLKIDFILSDPELPLQHHQIIKNDTFSDHYPVMSTFAW